MGPGLLEALDLQETLQQLAGASVWALLAVEGWAWAGEGATWWCWGAGREAARRGGRADSATGATEQMGIARLSRVGGQPPAAGCWPGPGASLYSGWAGGGPGWGRGRRMGAGRSWGDAEHDHSGQNGGI